MLIQGPLRAGISARTSFRRAALSSSECGARGSSSASGRFQKLVGANRCWPVGNGVTMSSAPMATGAATAGGVLGEGEPSEVAPGAVVRGGATPGATPAGVLAGGFGPREADAEMRPLGRLGARI